MATIKKGTFAKADEWWKHLRPDNKKKFWKQERLLVKKFIENEYNKNQ